MASIRVSVTLLLALMLGHVAAQPTSGEELVLLTPCRLADTRGNGFTGDYGPPALVGGASRNFVIAGQCGVPSTATAVSFNFTVVGATSPGFLTVYPAGVPLPMAALLQYGPGQSNVVSNPASVLLGSSGAISAYASNAAGTVDLIINVYGYYADVGELPGQNTAVGSEALLNNTAAGGANTAIGFQALKNNTTGNVNTALGVQTLFANTTGSFNTATGRQALVSNTTASNNTATGVYALLENTTGYDNTATGFQALLNNTTGSSNTAIGVSALQSNGTGVNNTATGWQALVANATGVNNTASGVAALWSNTTGSSNTATGVNALAFNTAGPDNTATGFQALLKNTTGGSNVALGVDALSGNTTGSFNIAVGREALGSINNTAGSGNIAIGDHAGFNVSTSNNIHIGHNGHPSGTDSALIRIGLFQTRTFIAGIRDATVAGGIQMFINNDGQLGTNPSAARFKEGIEPVGEDGRRLLALRPVRFRYKPAYDDPTRPLQYGLVAEEVAEVFPELVQPDSDGTPYSVRYHLLSVLLLNELQRQERERQEEKAQTDIRFDAQQERLAEQDARLAAQQRELDELRAQVRALVGAKAAAREE